MNLRPSLCNLAEPIENSVKNDNTGNFDHGKYLQSIKMRKEAM